MRNKKIIYLSGTAAIITLVIASIIYNAVFGVSIKVKKTNRTIYIPTGSTYAQLKDTLESDLTIKNIKIFYWLASKKRLPVMIKPGRYVIAKELSCNSLINLLRSGRQTPVKVTFNNIRTLNQIAGKIGKQIESDSTQIMTFLSDDSNFIKDGFDKENIISLFIPDSYWFNWNTDARGLYSRMLKAYKQFWNEKRLAQATEEGLSPLEVSILASIVDDEVTKTDEKPRIAGVYINRLKRGMPLQSCPTIKYALNDFTITRVLKKDLEVNSPYNTYIHSGFPPGPIGCATIEGLDAVLNAEKHDYLFFAAKADFSGYHNFSRTLEEHNKYAALYQKELDRRRIFR